MNLFFKILVALLPCEHIKKNLFTPSLDPLYHTFNTLFYNNCQLTTRYFPTKYLHQMDIIYYQ